MKNSMKCFSKKLFGRFKLPNATLYTSNGIFVARKLHVQNFLDTFFQNKNIKSAKCR